MNSPRLDLAAVLGQNALFSSLSPHELQLLATRTVRRHFSAGELLFSEGDACNGLHIIVHGRVRGRDVETGYLSPALPRLLERRGHAAG